MTITFPGVKVGRKARQMMNTMASEFVGSSRVGRRSFLKTCGACASALTVGAVGLGAGTDVASAHHYPVYRHGEVVRIPADNFNYVSPNVSQSGTNWRRRVESVPDVNGIGINTTAYSGGAGAIRANGWGGLQFTAIGGTDFTAGFAGNAWVPDGYSTITGQGSGTASNTVDFVVYDRTANRELARQRLFHQTSGALLNLVTLRPDVQVTLRPGRHYGAYFQVLSDANTTNTGTRTAFLLPTLNNLVIGSG